MVARCCSWRPATFLQHFAISLSLSLCHSLGLPLALNYARVHMPGQELYKSFLSDRLFLEQRLQAICKENGIGPKKLARCLKRGVAAVLNWYIYIYIYIYIAQLDDVYTGIMIHARLQSKVPVNFSFVDVTGTSVTEADATCHYIAHGHGLISGCAVRSNYISVWPAKVELNAVNFEFLQNYLGLFPQIPTAKESEAVTSHACVYLSRHQCMQEALCSVASEYSIVSRKASKAQIKESVLRFFLHASSSSSKPLHVQDWASTEGSLHRALAAYIHRRYSQNQGARLGSVVMMYVYTYMLHSILVQLDPARPGHEKMYLLKQIVRRVREEP